jgi:hypothetical protein
MGASFAQAALIVIVAVRLEATDFFHRLVLPDRPVPRPYVPGRLPSRLIRAHGGRREQPLQLLAATRRTGDPTRTTEHKLLEDMLAIRASILEDRHGQGRAVDNSVAPPRGR